MSTTYYTYNLKHFNNTKFLKVGDIVIVIPYPKDKINKENKIRFAVVESQLADKLCLIDLDSNEMFYWDLNCNIRNENFKSFIIE